jgi:NADH:flavin oxidoreductase/NADH oxidase family protein
MSTLAVPVARDGHSEKTRTDLFDSVQLGCYRLANRIVMARLTRSRANAGGTATPLMAEYYAQRMRQTRLPCGVPNDVLQARPQPR